jgi:hypothetical protein
VISWNGNRTSPSPFAKSLRQSLRRRSRSAGMLCATIPSSAVPFRRIAYAASKAAKPSGNFRFPCQPEAIQNNHDLGAMITFYILTYRY